MTLTNRQLIYLIKTSYPWCVCEVFEARHRYTNTRIHTNTTHSPRQDTPLLTRSTSLLSLEEEEEEEENLDSALQTLHYITLHYITLHTHRTVISCCCCGFCVHLCRPVSAILVELASSVRRNSHSKLFVITHIIIIIIIIIIIKLVYKTCALLYGSNKP